MMGVIYLRSVGMYQARCRYIRERCINLRGRWCSAALGKLSGLGLNRGVKKFRPKEFRATLKARSCTYSAASNASQLWYSLYISYAIQRARIIISNTLSTWVSRNQSCHTYYTWLCTKQTPRFVKTREFIFYRY